MFPVGGLIKKAKAMIPKAVTAVAKNVVKKVVNNATNIINRFEKNTSAVKKALATIPVKAKAVASKAQAITQKVAAAVPKVVNAAKAAGKKQLCKIAEVNNVIKTSILTKAVEINAKNLRILDKLGQEAQLSSDRILKGTGTLGAFAALNPNRPFYVGVDFLLTARETIIEEYPILNIGTEYSKKFISYMENQVKDLNDTIGSNVYNANIPLISDAVGAFTGQRDPNAESNIASMTGAFYRGLYVKGVGGTVDALANMAVDPFEAIKGLNSIGLEPEVMLPGIANLARDFVDNKIIHGSAEDRSEVAGQAVFEIAQFFIGTGQAKAATKAAEIGADAAKTSKAINLTTKATKVIKTEKLLNSTVFKGIKQTLSTTAKNSGGKAIESIDSLRLLLRNSSPKPVPSFAGIGHLDDFVGTGEMLQKGLSKIKTMASEIPVPKGVNIKGPKMSGKVEEGAEKAVKVAGKGVGGSNTRLIPGSEGVVTGGDSTKLGKNMMELMGLKRSTKWTGHQAQHLIPSEMKNHQVLQKIGMYFDDASNGLFLRTPADDISAMSRHRGYHSTYNEFVKSQLDTIDISQDVNTLQQQVLNLQSNLKKLQQGGLPLYPNQGASIDLWQRSLNRIK